MAELTSEDLRDVLRRHLAPLDSSVAKQLSRRKVAPAHRKVLTDACGACDARSGRPGHILSMALRPDGRHIGE